jgi:hypothetical protein
LCPTAPNPISIAAHWKQKDKKKRVVKYLPSEFPQSKAAIGSQLNMHKARCFTKHKNLLHIVFPVIPRGYHGKKKGNESRSGVRVSRKTHTHTHPTKWAFQFSETNTPKTVEEKTHWFTCPPITLTDWSKVFWSLGVPILQLGPVVLLLMKFHQFATYSKGLPQPLLNPPPPPHPTPKRGINFAKILGL